jgi:Zn-dependent protease with chaperone function
MLTKSQRRDNYRMEKITESANRWIVIQRGLGQRLSRRLYDDVLQNPLNPSDRRILRRTWSLTLAYFLAASVYAASIAIGIVGVTLLVKASGNLFVIGLGLVLILLCVVSRPRMVKPPEYLISRADYPILYELSDRIGDALGARPVDGIAISADFGANYRAVGWRRKCYIELGAPLLAILSPGERVAVIAHELSHGVNGDPLRGQFLFGAVNALSSWAVAIRPASIGHMGNRTPLGPLLSIVGIPLELLMLALSELLLLIAKSLLLLVFRQSQRAEYFADLLAATVAGSTEMQRALEKTYLFDVVDSAIRTHALTMPDEPIIGKLSAAVLALSVAESERYRVQSRESIWQVDSTHPPTAMRIDMLSANFLHPPSEQIPTDDLAKLDAEVNRLVASMQRELMNRKIEEMYV